MRQDQGIIFYSAMFQICLGIVTVPDALTFCLLTERVNISRFHCTITFNSLKEVSHFFYKKIGFYFVDISIPNSGYLIFHDELD